MSLIDNTSKLLYTKPIMEIHKIIKQRRQELKLTQEDVSFATVIDQSLYSKIERGVAKPSKSQLTNILSFLKIKNKNP